MRQTDVVTLETKKINAVATAAPKWLHRPLRNENSEMYGRPTIRLKIAFYRHF